MKTFPISVLADCFHTDIHTGIKKAAQLGVQGVQVYATSGEISADLNAQERKDFVNFCADNGIAIAALCGDFGGHGFTCPAEQADRIEKSRRIMDLALELGTKVVTTHIGVVPEDADDEAYHILQDGCGPLAEYGNQVGATFAIETGPETPKTLLGFLKSLGEGKGLGVNYDPANIAMVTGADVVEGVHLLKDYIVHVHAKDGIMLKKTDPVNIYKPWRPAKPESKGSDVIVTADEYFREVPLGQGSVPFDRWLGALEEIGYDYFLTIEREAGATPEADIKLAVDYLRGFFA